jgi:hypothetical protein
VPKITTQTGYCSCGIYQQYKMNITQFNMYLNLKNMVHCLVRPSLWNKHYKIRWICISHMITLGAVNLYTCALRKASWLSAPCTSPVRKASWLPAPQMSPVCCGEEWWQHGFSVRIGAEEKYGICPLCKHMIDSEVHYNAVIAVFII